jgi:HKD family nuclease
MEFMYQPRKAARLGDFLNENLKGEWTDFRAAIAFVKQSGTKHIRDNLASFSAAKNVHIIAGIDHLGTSLEGLQDLLNATKPTGKITIFHNRLRKTFHPKIYLFKSGTHADLVVGSGNLTEGGIFSNYEAAMRLKLDLEKGEHKTLLEAVETTLDRWADPASGTALTLDDSLLIKLNALGMVPQEALVVSEAAEAHEEDVDSEDAETEEAETETGSESEEESNPFAAVSEPAAPWVATGKPKAKPQGTPSSSADIATTATTSTTGFVMTLQTTDVGKGQTTAGTQRRSPEIFIPLSARDANPAFWEWPNGFAPDPHWKGKLDAAGRGKMDRHDVRLRLGGNIVTATIWYNPDKKDIRIRNEALRQAGAVDDILRMEKAAPSTGFDYYVEIIPQGTTQYPTFRALCTLKPPSPASKKRFGYY